tara:strand:- start:229 stop:384 length:156 start_codon:yes stop_codon:yes gene_type:complete
MTVKFKPKGLKSFFSKKEINRLRIDGIKEVNLRLNVFVFENWDGSFCFWHK